MWATGEPICNYEAIAKWLGRSRNPENGRPCGSSMRLHRSPETGMGDTDPIHLKDWQDNRVFTLTSDDKLTLHDDHGYWPTQRMYKWFGIAIRKKKLERHIYSDWHNDNVPYVGTIVYDLRTKRFVTRTPELTKTVADEDLARQWKRCVTQFRRKSKVMAKIGALDHVIKKAAEADHVSAYARDRLETFGFTQTDDPGKLMRQAIKNNDPVLALRVYWGWDASYMEFYYLGQPVFHSKYFSADALHKMCLDAYAKRRDCVRAWGGVISIGRPK